MMAAFAFSVSVAWWPGIAGAALTPRWIIIAVGASSLLMLGERLRFTFAHLWGSLFLGWCLLTWLWSASPDDTIGAGFRLVVLALVFCLGSLQRNMRPVYFGTAAGMAVCSVIASAQFWGWTGIPQDVVPAALFVNRNFYAEFAALVAVALIAERAWWWLPATAPGLILTGARGALLGLCVPLIWLWRRSWVGGVLLVAGIAAVLMVTFLTRAQWLDGYRADLVFDRTTDIHVRLSYWRATLDEITVTGAGLGSFYLAAPHPIEGLRADHPHNEFLELAFETGLIGLGLFVIFIGSIMTAGTTTETLVLGAALTEACFGFPFHEPATAFLGVLAAGGAAGRLRGICDPAGAGRADLCSGRARAGDREEVSTLPAGHGVLAIRSPAPHLGCGASDPTKRTLR